MLSPEEAAIILGVERAFWGRRTKWALPWLTLICLAMLLRLSEWAGGPLELSWIVLLAAGIAAGIFFLVRYTRRRMARLESALQRGETAAAQGAVTGLNLWDLKLGAEKFRLAPHDTSPPGADTGLA